MKYSITLPPVLLLGLMSAAGMTAAVAQAGTFSTATFAGDADSGISSANHYTHAIDLNGGPTTINGVLFAAGGTGPQPSLNYDLEGAVNSLGGNPNNLSGNIASLDSNAFYGGEDAETLTLTGLDDNAVYVATFYNVGFSDVGARYQDVTDDRGGSILYDENVNGNGNGSLLIDTYTTVGGSITFTWNINPTDSNPGDPNTGDGNSFLQFGFSNQLVPEPGSIVLLGLGTLGLAATTRRRLGRKLRIGS